MARSPAPISGSPARTAQTLWPVALIVALIAFIGSVALVAPVQIGFAVLIGAAGVVSLVLLTRLRAAHRRALADAASRAGEVLQRDADASRRDAQWRAYTEGQADLVRQELEHVVKVRLPAAMSGADIPPAGPDGAQLAAPVVALFDRLLGEVKEEARNQSESQRLSLVELASRVQTSAHRIQATVTGLADRYPGDADLLEATMQVDHAATQQARHAQSLKVLCGEWPGQQWQKPLALVDVVRAASGRIVAYRRIAVSGEPDVGVNAAVVEPLIHVMAELLANATEYSPPRTSVPVTVRTVQRGAVIEVDDGGLGLDEYRLSHAREIVSGRRLLGVGEVGEIPQTGFAVVGRFADRHGFQVDLGPSPYGGVRAVVLVPLEALETLDPVGARAPRTPQVPAPQAPVEQAPAQTPAQLPAAPAQERQESESPRVPPQLDPSPAEQPPAARRAGSRLPQRRSRRGEHAPAVEAAPSVSTPPGTPEEAGDWMGAFFAGGQSASSNDLPDRYQGQDGPSSTTPESPEGQP